MISYINSSTVQSYVYKKI